MSTTDPNRAGRQGDRPGGGMPRPATPMVAVVIAAVAGLLGLLVLKNVKDDSSGGSSNTPKTTVASSTTASDTSVVPTTTIQMIRTGATVIVANASKTDGMAGSLSTDLKTRGYTMGKPVTATVVQDTTQILARWVTLPLRRWRGRSSWRWA